MPNGSEKSGEFSVFSLGLGDGGENAREIFIADSRCRFLDCAPIR